MPRQFFETLFVVGLVVGSVIRGRFKWKCRHDRATDDRPSVLDICLLALAGVGMTLPLVYLPTRWLDFADYASPAWAGWTGALMFAAALWLLWKSHVDLGRNWSVAPQIREGQSLVTGGVYRHIRHPMYASHVLWAIAQVLLLANWIVGPAMLVLMLPLYIERVPREERMMLDRFGEEYRSYMARTGRLIPRLWGR